MQIKRIEAKSMTDALRQIKRELGPEAVILSARDIKKENRLLGITRTCGVEVTAAVDAPEHDAPEVESPLSSSPAVSGRMEGDGNHEGRKRLIHRIQDVVRIGGGLPRSKPETHAKNEDRPHLSRRLEMSGMGEKWSDRLLKAASDAIGGVSLGEAETVAAGLRHMGFGVRPVPQATGRQKALAVVGPNGAGKTTSLAKLAAWHRFRLKQSVGLVTLDDNRLGSSAQLSAYARILGIQLEKASLRGGLSDCLCRLKHCDTVLIDTPGIRPGDQGRMAMLTQCLQKVGDLHTLLVVSAATRRRDLQRAVEAFSPLPAHGAVLTRMDETDQAGDVVPVFVKSGLPVAYFGVGVQVPMDLEAASLTRFAAYLLEGPAAVLDKPERVVAAPAAGVRPAEPPLYLANRSSDIFHTPECRWIRLIRKGNIVEFHSFADAVESRYKPCRYCKPKAAADPSPGPDAAAAAGRARYL
ncbi:MAG: Ada metal-binding domain-containing protein [Desulfobacterales bacterium]